ncbi:hypothetical protein K1S05_27125 [Klebsiella pneumoniae]|uniref:Uncharacterized protein n=4 Tax=Enterobacteriaceae TaxID=543 RepID=A0A3G2CDV4_ECOLX|nr:MULTISPECIES: hypothetical protein [Enterobacteriaceae]AVA18683.1 Hypothetical protein [Citrobacter freundii]AVE22477.1 hypothetical protein [Enterobacter hormaechei]AVX51597.1 hypothetical protein [Klebsiella pneumoniae]AYM50837.1 hypothetical protein [Escherichia coli]MBC4622438.1 hypothetical protein [Klebsiella pneumoniae]
MAKVRNPEVTQKRLLDALQRLVDGQPERLTSKYKVNVKSVQEEAGLSLGAAYRYPDVMDAIEAAKLEQSKRSGNLRKRNVNSELDRLRKEKAKEVTLKEKYRTELTEANSRLDQLYAEQTMQLMAMFNLLDIKDKSKLLQKSSSNVVRIK